MLENKVPAVDVRLVEWLEQQFPNRLPPYVATDLNEINVGIGIQRVIRRLRQEYEEQTDNSTTIR